MNKEEEKKHYEIINEDINYFYSMTILCYIATLICQLLTLFFHKEETLKVVENKYEIKFNDKYKDKLELMAKTFHWIADIQYWKQENHDKIYDKLHELKMNYENEITTLKTKIEMNNSYLANNQQMESESESESDSDSSESDWVDDNKKKSNKTLALENEEYQIQLNNLHNSLTDEKSLLELAEKIILKLYFDVRLQALMNNFVMEYTPTGNIIMSYDSSKGAFVYYSNNTIMYSNLLVVCRKFVCLYNCLPLYTKHIHKHIKFVYAGKTHNFNILQKQPKRQKSNDYLSFADFKQNKKDSYSGMFN